MNSSYTYGWDFITSTWDCIERQAHLDEWKEVDPDLKQLGRVLADQFLDPPKEGLRRGCLIMGPTVTTYQRHQLFCPPNQQSHQHNIPGSGILVPLLFIFHAFLH
ncbi:unnamed protein product [Cuscuta europaea]|uniref:Uncharacterized protein n=1 Tax=Cuscuta europaea TaxID=41803 RepID=A0A9P1EKW5_CUSEU|nr:unnamed protein product [Cuscuta europaea]